MIQVFANLYDHYSVELKIQFLTRKKLKHNDFEVNTWFFIPNSIDINRSTYSKEQFYSDVQSTIRLVTPIYLLNDIAGELNSPLTNLAKSIEKMLNENTRTSFKHYEYELQIFLAIFKSATRDTIAHITDNSMKEDTEFLCHSYLQNMKVIRNKFRLLQKLINAPVVSSKAFELFLFGDEFLSNCIIQNTFALNNYLEKWDAKRFESIIQSNLKLIKKEWAHKEQKGYLIISNTDEQANQRYIFRQSILDKYVESVLSVNANTKRDGVWTEQIYYSLAAGISMVFATGIAFSFQQKYGNFTMPLFVALVVSYMLKDRIKDLMRYYFAGKLSNKHFDHNTTLSLKEEKIGNIKESMDFITDLKVPKSIMKIRNRTSLVELENRIHDEKILLYRKRVTIDRDKLDITNDYIFKGINDIIQFNFTRMIQRMANPKTPLFTLNKEDDGSEKTSKIYSTKIYYINFIMQIKHQDDFYYKRFRITCSKHGIHHIEELKDFAV
ncbi:MAG: hypothetical protein LBE34_00465 [Flavobacteriaceae bacterium]|jgi:hypothetical protein|nr:hypothetical protein [Flavobacteriaceae bacterium]